MSLGQVLGLVDGEEGGLRVLERALLDLGQADTGCEVELDVLPLVIDAVKVVLAQSSELAMGVLIDRAADLLVKLFGIFVDLLSLLLIHLTVEVVREELRDGVTHQAAAACSAHESGEDASDFLDDEECEEEASADRVENYVRLSESVRLDTRQ